MHRKSRKHKGPTKKSLTKTALLSSLLVGANAGMFGETPEDAHNRHIAEEIKKIKARDTEKTEKYIAQQERNKEEKIIEQALRHIKSTDGIINTFRAPISSTLSLPIKLNVGDVVRIKSKSDENGEDVVITDILPTSTKKKPHGPLKYKVMKLAHQVGGPQNVFTVEKKDIIPARIGSTTLGMADDWIKLDEALKTGLQTEQDLGMYAPAAKFYPDYEDFASKRSETSVGPAWAKHQLDREGPYLELRNYVTAAMPQPHRLSYSDVPLKQTQIEEAVRKLATEYSYKHDDYDDQDDGDDADDDEEEEDEKESALEVARQMWGDYGKGYKRKKHKKTRKGSRKGTRKGTRKQR